MVLTNYHNDISMLSKYDYYVNNLLLSYMRLIFIKVYQLNDLEISTKKWFADIDD
jgi:hypothetical protein